MECHSLPSINKLRGAYLTPPEISIDHLVTDISFPRSEKFPEFILYASMVMTVSHPKARR